MEEFKKTLNFINMATKYWKKEIQYYCAKSVEITIICKKGKCMRIFMPVIFLM